MGCAVLAVCAVGFSAYRILVERMPDEIRGTRLVMEHDASYLPTAGMVRLENAGFSSMVHGLENGGSFSHWRSASWRRGKRIFWKDRSAGVLCASMWFATLPAR